MAESKITSVLCSLCKAFEKPFGLNNDLTSRKSLKILTCFLLLFVMAVLIASFVLWQTGKIIKLYLLINFGALEGKSPQGFSSA